MTAAPRRCPSGCWLLAHLRPRSSSRPNLLRLPGMPSIMPCCPAAPGSVLVPSTNCACMSATPACAITAVDPCAGHVRRAVLGEGARADRVPDSTPPAGARARGAGHAGEGAGAQGVGFGVWGLGSGVRGLGSGCGAQGVGFGVKVARGVGRAGPGAGALAHMCVPQPCAVTCACKGYAEDAKRVGTCHCMCAPTRLGD